MRERTGATLRRRTPRTYGALRVDLAEVEGAQGQVARRSREVQRMEAALRESQARVHALESRLLQSEKMETLGRFASGIAHDFNNVLAGVLGNAQHALRRVRPGEPSFDELTQIVEYAHRAAGLTAQLLAFARNRAPKPGLLDVNAVVTDTEGFLGHLVGNRVQVLTDLEPGLERVEMDPGQLQQVLMNLAVNARDAMPHGGTLTIATAGVPPRSRVSARSAAHGEVVVSVSDTGTGMSDEVLAHAFEPFFTTKEPGAGTGLGLATSHDIVLRAGGRMEVETCPGVGTTFRVVLPAV